MCELLCTQCNVTKYWLGVFIYDCDVPLAMSINYNYIINGWTYYEKQKVSCWCLDTSLCACSPLFPFLCEWADLAAPCCNINHCIKVWRKRNSMYFYDKVDFLSCRWLESNLKILFSSLCECTNTFMECQEFSYLV